VSNKFKFVLPATDKYIDLPIELKWDFYGRDDSIEIYEHEVIEEIIGTAYDFEVFRFSHEPYNENTKTDIKYDFHFFDESVNIKTSSSVDWVTSYLTEGFTSSEVYYYEKPFTKSFFKLDFYDTTEGKSQTNYFTVIIPVQQGFTESVSISEYGSNINIKIPSYQLDFVGDKEGFFLYWLRKKDFIDIDTFYMSAKFFDARLGVYVKMSKTPQILLKPTLFQFSDSNFYYKVKLDLDKKTYQIFDKDINNNDVRVGTTSSIKWYEYVNP
jgi:hypothetical protein